MEDTFLQLIQAWVQLSGMLKNSRFTKALPYNESIIMLQLYEAGEQPISIKEITLRTRMLKSQVNRTINSLEAKGLLERCEGDGDRRIGYVRLRKEQLPLFLQVHAESMQIAQNISDIIGPEDTDHFIRIVNKLAQSGYHL
jgi:DNA-binding MarR family transcriptional regulator